MARIGVPVPPGFVITTETSLEYFRQGRRFPDGLWEEIVRHVHVLEEQTGRRFGAAENPLVVSVRSGAPVSMPGMMDTILNMGVTDTTIGGLVKMMGDDRPALDAFRRLIQGFGDVVLGIPKSRFETTLEAAKKQAGAEFDYELQPDALQELVQEFKSIIEEATGEPLSDDPWALLKVAVEAVFNSWNNPRAITYREFQGIPTTWAPRASSWRWCSATWETTAAPACSSPATPAAESADCMESSCRTRRERTWWRGYALPNGSRRCVRPGRRSTTR